MDLEVSKDGMPATSCGYPYQNMDLTGWSAFADGSFGGNPVWDSGSYIPASNGSISDWPGLNGFSSLVPSGDLGPPTVWPLAEVSSGICKQEFVSAAQAEDAISPTLSWSQPASPVDTFGTATPATPKLVPFTRSNSRTKAAARSPDINKKLRPPTKLRSAARKPRKSSVAASKPTTRGNEPPPSELHRVDEKEAIPAKIRARRNHNIVEKQYRNRLNAQFERLLSVLPLEQQKAPAPEGNPESPSARKRRPSSCSETTSTPEDRRLSKAEVLDVATNRIKELEADRERLLREKQDLLHSIEVVGAVVTNTRARESGKAGS
ncbi:hypothetical protein B0T14DRAFT_139084 [Immersiella caudata]|uniref:BHLH domain-containing protein n=1 Tax=Immersiella caudata TaxID=314043 RepID=A0AA39X5B2_9PEZI|nr:hypothetical protein B0T14DRAFT_139084 [Immersiella caudata]